MSPSYFYIINHYFVYRTNHCVPLNLFGISRKVVNRTERKEVLLRLYNNMSLQKSKDCNTTLNTSIEAEDGSKRVRWSLDLEEIRYFKSKETHSKTFGQRFRKMKEKLNDLADRVPMNVFLVQNGWELVKLIKGRSASYDIKGNEEAEMRAWDRLFEIYAI